MTKENKFEFESRSKNYPEGRESFGERHKKWLGYAKEVGESAAFVTIGILATYGALKALGLELPIPVIAGMAGGADVMRRHWTAEDEETN